MSESFDLSDTRTFFLLPVTLIVVVFIALPTVTMGRLLRDRTRCRTWTTTRARLLAPGPGPITTPATTVTATAAPARRVAAPRRRRLLA